MSPQAPRESEPIFFASICHPTTYATAQPIESEKKMSSSCCGSSPAKEPQRGSVSTELPIVIIGTGPVGLAAAANCAQRGLPFLILDKGSRVGHAVESWAQVRLFSPWRYNMEKQSRSLLEKTDWQAPDDEALPSGRELLEQYLQPLAAHPSIQPFLRLNAEVVTVGRKNLDRVRSSGRESQPFELTLAGGERSTWSERHKRYETRAKPSTMAYYSICRRSAGSTSILLATTSGGRDGGLGKGSTGRCVSTKKLSVQFLTNSVVTRRSAESSIPDEG